MLFGVVLLMAVAPAPCALAKIPLEPGSTRGPCAGISFKEQPRLYKQCHDFGADGASTMLPDPHVVDNSTVATNFETSGSDAWLQAEYIWFAVSIGVVAGVGVAFIRRHHHPTMIS
jgi:hypothetical protein